MKITVVVPTYRRSKDLARCLAALKVQIRPVDELWIIVRDTDEETRTFLQNFDIESLPLQIATVTAVGVVAAMNIGLESASGDIIAFTDDDAAPHSDWLERIEAYFLSDPNVAGVGGRDWVYHGTELEDGAEPIVGKLQWFGRLIGNHHIGIGQEREVDVLKGVNMSFRRTAIQNLQFDQRMRGTGAQVHFEVMFCLQLKQLGWKLIYDPQIGVDHFRGDRFDEDQRDKFNQLAMLNAVHNETLALLEYLPILRRVAFLGWAIAIGTRDARGLLQWLRFLPKEGNLSSQKLWASWRGRWEGWQTWRNSYQK
ncbi:glycosyltransferase family 2 protein [Pseudanabaena sp. ABRG5-3]|uniref:glycosyltransferase family 2 protein n=1 Tax=Pseudanabaena sp. ABRG5-3 TaxID=685565 RepID=UPI000DC70608|nr:glycosyltransferase [Pseudanabaena sp. ABRG5-3]BBC24547.1 glycosyl transferase family 2 [Pseudanabaena sp. ABRG5-3]